MIFFCGNDISLLHARARGNLQNLYKLFSLQPTFARHWKILSVARNNAKTGVREVNSRSARFPVTPDFGSHRKSLNFTRAVQKASGDLPVIPVYLWYIQLVQVSIVHFINFLLQQSYSLIYTWYVIRSCAFFFFEISEVSGYKQWFLSFFIF